MIGAKMLSTRMHIHRILLVFIMSTFAPVALADSIPTTTLLKQTIDALDEAHTYSDTCTVFEDGEPVAILRSHYIKPDALRIEQEMFSPDSRTRKAMRVVSWTEGGNMHLSPKPGETSSLPSPGAAVSEVFGPRCAKVTLQQILGNRRGVRLVIEYPSGTMVGTERVYSIDCDVYVLSHRTLDEELRLWVDKSNGLIVRAQRTDRTEHEAAVEVAVFRAKLDLPLRKSLFQYDPPDLPDMNLDDDAIRIERERFQRERQR